MIVRKEFAGILERSLDQIHTRAIPTDSLIYSEREFDQQSGDPLSFLGRNLPSALEL